MNTALRGGHDLGWKLGWVLRGWAGPKLLDSYEAERRPVAAHNVARSADPEGSSGTPPTSSTWTWAGASPRLGRAGGARGLRSTSSGAGPTLFTGPESRPVGPRAAGAAGRRAWRSTPSPPARSASPPARALLVRPDGAPERLWVQEAAVAA